MFLWSFLFPTAPVYIQVDHSGTRIIPRLRYDGIVVLWGLVVIGQSDCFGFKLVSKHSTVMKTALSKNNNNNNNNKT